MIKLNDNFITKSISDEEIAKNCQEIPAQKSTVSACQNQGCEIFYLNIFFQKINILFDSISAMNILYLLSCNILEKQ